MKLSVSQKVEGPGPAGGQQELLRIVSAVSKALYLTGEQIMAESKKLVPVDTGTLRSSGYVELPDVDGTRVFVRLGYGGPAAPYALRVHENPRSGKTGGVSPSGQKYKSWAKVGQWKFLQTPFLEAQASGRLKQNLEARLKG